MVDSMHLERSIQQPIRDFVDMDHRWRGPDGGLIWCWERGRQMTNEDPGLAERATQGELVPLPWKGGVNKSLKTSKMRGCVFYLAHWQGLAGKDLDIDTDGETRLICTATGIEVIYSRIRDLEIE